MLPLPLIWEPEGIDPQLAKGLEAAQSGSQQGRQYKDGDHAEEDDFRKSRNPKTAFIKTRGL